MDADDAPAVAAPVWRRAQSDAEFLWLRLVVMHDEIQTAIARLEREGADAHAVAALRRLREDLLAALRLAVRLQQRG